MGKHVKNQHYVPQFLLRHFSNDGNLIWCYDRKWKTSSERSISKVASEDYFYDPSPGRKDGSFEYLLARIESDTAPVILKIIQSKSLQIISLKEREIVAFFIALQLSRSKSFLNNAERFHKDFFNPVKEFADAMKVNIEAEQTPKELWFASFSSVPDFSTILLKKIWFLIESDKAFFSSDNPIVLQNSYNRNPDRGTLGIDSDGIEIYFPLTDSLLVCLCCERIYECVKDQKLEYNEENIENVNSLQVAYSERFVFSSQNNFELVEDMIKKKQI
jgi:hypothetical protein